MTLIFLCPYLNPFPWPAEEVSARAALVGSWCTARVKPPHKPNMYASLNNMVLLHNSFAIPMKYHQQLRMMAKSQHICTQIPYMLQVKCLEHAISWLWNWPEGEQHERRLLRPWKGRWYKVSPWEGLHGYCRIYVCWKWCMQGYDMRSRPGQLHFESMVSSHWPHHEFFQSVIPSWEDGCAQAHSRAQLGYTTLHQASSPWWNLKQKSTQD